MFEIKFMTGFSWTLSKNRWGVCLLGVHALLLKARTAPKEGPVIPSVGWPVSAGLDLGCATTDTPLKSADGISRTTSPTPSKLDKEESGFFWDSQALRMCLPLTDVEFGQEWWAVVIFGSSFGCRFSFPFFPTESWESRRWLVVYYILWVFVQRSTLFVCL